MLMRKCLGRPADSSCLAEVICKRTARNRWAPAVQVGFGRPGFYSNDLLDNFARPSLRVIDSGLQDLEIGQWGSMSPTLSEATAWKIDGFARNQWLLWRKPDSTWSWVLHDLGDGSTRLVARVHVHYCWPRPAYSVFGVVLMEVGDFAMMRRMLLGIKQRAERVAAAMVLGTSCPPPRYSADRGEPARADPRAQARRA